MKVLRWAKQLAFCLLVAAPVGASVVDAEGEDRFLGNVRQLTFEGRRSGEGYFSADGRHLVFQSEREPGNPFFQPGAPFLFENSKSRKPWTGTANHSMLVEFRKAWEDFCSQMNTSHREKFDRQIAEKKKSPGFGRLDLK